MAARFLPIRWPPVFVAACVLFCCRAGNSCAEIWQPSSALPVVADRSGDFLVEQARCFEGVRQYLSGSRDTAAMRFFLCNQQLIARYGGISPLQILYSGRIQDAATPFRFEWEKEKPPDK